MRVLVRGQGWFSFFRVFPPPEITGDTDHPFELSYKEIRELPCPELDTLAGEVRTYREKLAEEGRHGAKEVSIVVVRGSNFNTEIGEALDFLQGQASLITDEMKRKGCAG